MFTAATSFTTTPNPQVFCGSFGLNGSSWRPLESFTALFKLSAHAFLILEDMLQQRGLASGFGTPRFRVLISPLPEPRKPLKSVTGVRVTSSHPSQAMSVEGDTYTTFGASWSSLDLFQAFLRVGEVKDGCRWPLLLLNSLRGV